MCKIHPFRRMTHMTWQGIQPLNESRLPEWLFGSESNPREHTTTRLDHCTATVLMAENAPYLQLNTCKSGALHTSKRTAPQWQPPVCFTRPSRSLETTAHLHQETICASLAHVFTNVWNQRSSVTFFKGSKINTRYVCQCSFCFDPQHCECPHYAAKVKVT